MSKLTIFTALTLTATLLPTLALSNPKATDAEMQNLCDAGYPDGCVHALGYRILGHDEMLLIYGGIINTYSYLSDDELKNACAAYKPGDGGPCLAHYARAGKAGLPPTFATPTYTYTPTH